MLVPTPKKIERKEGWLSVSAFKPIIETDILSERKTKSLIESILGLKVGETGTPVIFSDKINLNVETPRQDEVYQIQVNDKVLVYAKGYKGFVNALASLRQLLKGGRIPLCNILDYPSFKYRGIVEGFYYDPWSWDDRRMIIEFMALYKMNSYIYAPKDDPYHREKWRIAYPEEILTEIKSLVSLSNFYGIDFIFAVSPGLSAVYSSVEDEDRLVEKFLSVAKLGVKSFGIFYDDIPPKLLHEEDKEKYSTLAEAHADFSNRVYNRLRKELGDILLIVCPTEYRGVELGEYFRELGSKLDPNILLMWTGPLVCSPKIGFEEAKKVSELAHGRLVVWDNYPVNDYVRNRLNLGALENRDKRLSEVLDGLFFNPMNEASASKMALATGADYLWNPEKYEPDSSLKRFLEIEYGEKSELFLFLAYQLGWSTIWPREPKEIEFISKLKSGIKPLEDIEKYFRKLIGLSDEIRVIDPHFYKDVERFLYKLTLYGEAGLEGLKAYYSQGISEAWLHLANMLNEWYKARGLYEIVGCTSIHDESVWTTFIVRDFINELLYEIINLVLEKWKFGLQVPRILGNTDHVAGCDISKIFDGKVDTSLIYRRRTSGKEEVIIEFSNPIKEPWINMVQENVNIGGLDPVEYEAEVHSTTGIEKYRVISGSLKVSGNISKIKLKALTSTINPAPLKINIVKADRRVYTNTSSTTNVYNIVDDRLDTFYETKVSSGDWILINLKKKETVKKIRILQDPRATGVFKIFIAEKCPLFPLLDPELAPW
ncbi:MAG TPA: hypothetical protein ENF87_03335, partial [Thermoproteales archaeon]|nr:hypothetical protein [Thermoproteales archaeon]